MVQAQNLKLVQLYQTAIRGSKDQNRAFEQLLAGNMGLLGLLVKKTYRKKEQISFDELMQCARVGLYNAAENYDPSKGINFCTYAYKVIRHKLNAEVCDSALLYISDHYRKKGCEPYEKDEMPDLRTYDVDFGKFNHA